MHPCLLPTLEWDRRTAASLREHAHQPRQRFQIIEIQYLRWRMTVPSRPAELGTDRTFRHERNGVGRSLGRAHLQRDVIAASECDYAVTLARQHDHAVVRRSQYRSVTERREGEK